MRSTIFTRAGFTGAGFTRAGFTAAALLPALVGASLATAQESPRHGCYERAYTAAHLSGNPAQIVARMLLRVGPDPYGNEAALAEMAVWTADQGHVQDAGQGGQRFDQALFCFGEGKAASCAVECDGGSFTVQRDDGGVPQFTTDYLMIGNTEECGGAVDLAERPGVAVSYRLARVDDAACAAEMGPRPVAESSGG